jgi:two-component system sensor histidine kinase HydH
VAAAIVSVLTLIDALTPQVGVVTYGVVNRALVLVGIWVSAWLVTRYGAVGRELDRSLKELHEQAALARLGEMTAVVAHEVRNPLAGIRGALQVIGGRVPERGDRAVISDIVARLDGLDDIVEDLLVFARPREPKLSRVALVDLLETTAAALKRDPEYADLDVCVSGDRAVIEADADQLHLVLLNLLINAAQATGSGGHIRVSATVEYKVCRIAIADNGPGIPAEIRPRIMEPFFTTKHRGTGLGLPTAKRVVERHRGTLAFECPPGGGTIVTVTLPLVPR